MPILTIDNIKVEVPEGTSVLDACRQAGAKVPTLCYLEDVQAIGACRVCLVEVEGAKTLVASCAQPAADGMVVHTSPPRGPPGPPHGRRAAPLRARRRLPDLRPQRATASCATSPRSSASTRSPTRARGRASIIDDSTPALVRDTGKCIMCRRCVTVCNETQGVGGLFPQGRGFATVIGPAFASNLSDVVCVQCGQCAAVCPVGAITEKSAHRPGVGVRSTTPPSTWSSRRRRPSAAPSARSSATSRARWSPARWSAPCAASASTRVFDTNFTADLTIMEEGTELLTRLKNALVDRRGRGPAHVHQLLAGLDQLHGALQPGHARQPLHAASRPQQMFGALAKTYYADEARQGPRGHRRGLDHAVHGQEVRVRSAPRWPTAACQDVDMVLTTRELARMIKQAGIDFRSPARRQDGRAAGHLHRRRRHLRRHRRRHGGGAAHGLRDRHRQAVPVREPARGPHRRASKGSRKPR